MKWDDKFPDSPAGNFEPPTLQIWKIPLDSQDVRCWHCGEYTRWMDINFEAGICSEECYKSKWEEYWRAYVAAGPIK